LSTLVTCTVQDADGLIERDVPGGPDAIARAVEAVLETLEREQRGLTTYRAFRLAREQVAPLAWEPAARHVAAAQRAAAALSRSGHVGLESWDDGRAPVRAAVSKHLDLDWA